MSESIGSSIEGFKPQQEINKNNNKVKYELGKIDALLNVASIITTLLNN